MGIVRFLLSLPEAECFVCFCIKEEKPLISLLVYIFTTHICAEFPSNLDRIGGGNLLLTEMNKFIYIKNMNIYIKNIKI